MDARVELLVELIDRAYDLQSWHGPNLRSSLKGIHAEDAAWRPGPNRHNIWEFMLHAAYWKYVARRRMLNEKRGSFPLKGSNFFVRPQPGLLLEAEWEKDLALLQSTHDALREAVLHFRAADLQRRKPGSKVTLFQLLSGVASHDIYHAGQISLLKRMMREG